MSVRVISTQKGKPQGTHHHIWMILGVLLPRARVGKVSNDDHDGAEDGKDDRKDTGARGNRERLVGHSLSNRTPRGDGGSGEGASFSVEVNDAGIGLCEQHEHGRRHEHGDDRSETLCNPLLERRRTKQETDTEVTGQVGCLVGAHGSKRTAEQVETFSMGLLLMLALGCATEDDLRCLGGSGKGRDVRDAGALHREEREEESKENGEK